MRKLILSLVLGLLFAQPVLAAVPDGTYFFMDNKGYDESGKQTFFCFDDGSCYTVEGVLSFTREITNKIDQLNQKITDLQNTVNQLQQPVGVQPLVINKEIIDILPAYTEEQLAKKLYELTPVDKQGNKPAYTYDRYWPVVVTTFKQGEFNDKNMERKLSGNVAVIALNGYFGVEKTDIRKNLKVLVDGKEVLGEVNPTYAYNYPINNGITVESQPQYFVENLELGKTYSYQVVWTESGRQNTVITKTFTAN